MGTIARLDAVAVVLEARVEDVDLAKAKRWHTREEVIPVVIVIRDRQDSVLSSLSTYFVSRVSVRW